MRQRHAPAVRKQRQLFCVLDTHAIITRKMVFVNVAYGLAKQLVMCTYDDCGVGHHQDIAILG